MDKDGGVDGGVGTWVGGGGGVFEGCTFVEIFVLSNQTC